VKVLLAAALALAAEAAHAFDSAGWLGKREVFAREAERLRLVYSNCVARLQTPA